MDELKLVTRQPDRSTPGAIGIRNASGRVLTSLTNPQIERVKKGQGKKWEIKAWEMIQAQLQKEQEAAEKEGGEDAVHTAEPAAVNSPDVSPDSRGNGQTPEPEPVREPVRKRARRSKVQELQAPGSPSLQPELLQVQAEGRPDPRSEDGPAGELGSVRPVRRGRKNNSLRGIEE